MNHFDLLPEHITLLRNSYVNTRLSGCEYGAAEIDPKRPYGNGDVELDIVELLWPDKYESLDRDYDDDENEEIRLKARALHYETPMALQIVLVTGSFEPGHYVCDYYRINWRRHA